MASVPSPDRVVAALDLGGTKTAGALVGGDGELLVRAERPTAAEGDAEAVFAGIAGVLDELARHPEWARIGALGVASAGPVDTAAGTVGPVNIPAWRGFPLVRRIAERVPAPVRLLGDGVAVAEAEHWLGAAAEYRNVLCMVVSTGVGGGLVLDGLVHPGPTGNAGHIGHVSIQWDGEPCPCGGRGCLEGLASGPAIVRHARTAGWRPPGGCSATARTVADSARSGDGAALAAFDLAARALAAAIAGAAALVELQAVVIGGGVAQSGSLLFDPLTHHLTQYTGLPFTRGLRLHPAHFGTDAGLIGAAAVALRSS
ncbi:ROK family protein [Streptomyces sp. TLI_171]|uniref:ROK family protein n=1 Tax=Streptomyces sp. TLI_171 TaxID=1938859 RepID=UPI000C190D05|nr:ROK family protein [Streptomyces sp. TLI_171]RKE22308.1 glucokinase [Streptomyces sp. TLI_171]